MSFSDKDFAKLRFKFWGKCKVCKIVYADSDLFTKIHKLRFIENYSLAGVRKYLEEKFIEKNFSIILPNEVNLHNHFKKHIPIEIVAAYTTMSKKNAVVKVPKSELPVGTQNRLMEIVDERIAVYDDLETLYKKFKGMVEEYEKEFDGKISVSNSGDYAVLVKELKSFLVELAKMNSNEQLVKVILQTAFQKYTVAVLQGIMKENDILKMTLRGYITDKDEVDRVLSGHQQRLYDNLSSGSREAIEFVKDQYKIN